MDPRTARHARAKLIVLLGIVFGVPAVIAAIWGANTLDGWLPDGVGTDSMAWLRTQDVAPGDTVAIRVVGKAGYKTAITSLVATFGTRSLMVDGSQPTWGGTVSSRASNEDEEVFALDLPETAPLGDATIFLAVQLVIAMPTGEHRFTNTQRNDAIVVPITIRSPGDRTLHRWLDRAIAVGAWVLAFVAAYWLARSRPRGRIESSAGANVYVWLLGILVGIAVLGMAGQLAFVRPILRTTAARSSLVTIGLMIAWLLALVVGGAVGTRRRTRELRWWPVRVRAVIGTTPMTTAFREAGTTLPPSLSRDADRKPDAEVVQAIEAAGWKVTRQRKRLVVTAKELPVLRIRAKQPAPWRPEDLALEVFQTADAMPALRTLADLYGPIEYTSPRGETTIVEPTRSS